MRFRKSLAIVVGAGAVYALAGVVPALAATGDITTVAGVGTGGFSGDGAAATAAELSGPYSVAVDSAGNLYISEFLNDRVRKVDHSTGFITTVAGSGTTGFGGDGAAATAAELNRPRAVAVNGAGDLFIADSLNHRIRKVDHSTGFISTVAGNGTAGFSGDGAAATAAGLHFPYSVAVDGVGDLFIADTNSQRIRKVDHSTGFISTVAGNGTAGFSGDGAAATAAGLRYPSSVVVDGARNVFIGDANNHRVRKVDHSTGFITTVAGNGTQGFGGDGAAATAAQINNPAGLAVDSFGDLYIADYYNERIRRVTGVGSVTLPPTGTDTAGLVWLAVGLLGAGAVLVGTRRRQTV